jgi:hypothetical protein
MNQLDLFLESRCKYLVLVNGRKVECWYFDGVFTSMSYAQLKDCEIIERIGNERELFGKGE